MKPHVTGATATCGQSVLVSINQSPLSILRSLTCPCMFMMTTVFDLLHTTKCSGFLGSSRMLFTVMSPAPPRVLNVLLHSVDLMLHTLTVPSDEALQTMTLIQHTPERRNTHTPTSSRIKQKNTAVDKPHFSYVYQF